MDPVYLPPGLYSLDPPGPFTLGVDYAWDGTSNSVRRLPGSAIPDGGTVLALQEVELSSPLIAALADGRLGVLAAPRLRVRAIAGWNSETPSIVDWTDHCWRAELGTSLASEPATATLVGPPALADAIEALPPSEWPALIEVAAVLSGDFHLPLFEGIIHGLDERASDDGRVSVALSLADPLRLLEPPYEREVEERFGPRLLGRGRIDPPVSVDGGFGAPRVPDSAGVEVYPTAHQILRQLFRSLEGPYFTGLSLGILDFPVPVFDARGFSILGAIRELARLAGGQVVAEGRVLVIRELGPASRTPRATFIYPEGTVHQLEEGEPADAFTSITLIGHSQTGQVPTTPSLPFPLDPSQPGYVRLGETEGTVEPAEPRSTDEHPPDLVLTFTFNATLYDPATLIVDGARRIGPATLRTDGGITWGTIELALPWLVTDTTGDPPFTLDENGDPRFFITGQIVDALAVRDGEPLGIPYPTVTRERLVAGEPVGESETILGDGQGYYRFTDVPLGVWRIRAEAPGYRENWQDDDPDNNLVRDLEAEYADWLAGQADGRFRKEPTPYHITVWGRPRVPEGEVQDLTLGQVRVRVRAEGVDEPDLRQAPTVRDERLTTERLAIRVGQIVLWASHQSAVQRALTAAPNPLLRPGDRITIRGSAGDTRFDCGRLVRTFDAAGTRYRDRIEAVGPALARRLVPHTPEDPL
ncbi:MAG TPA: carboxypeptidase-like regulatory domain-containing protein, partial [bacterium]|nr:carboxypeptidase-like regulatory domain-containing protein [bacterium]